jgi:hypothetical protein
MTSTTENGLRIWEKVQATDPAFTKSFTGHLGFQGTAVNPTYVFRKATEMFGPIGLGWGADVIQEEMIKGAPIGVESESGATIYSIVHKAKVELWYIDPETKQKALVYQYGGTKFLDRDNEGKLYCDDDVWKKSMTDGMCKCLSLVGVSADVHLGLYDDNKYVQGLEVFFAEKAAAHAQQGSNGGTQESGAARQQRTSAGDQRQDGDGKYSKRYLQWKERLLAGISEDEIPRTRQIIQADKELNKFEIAMLLGSEKLKASGKTSQGSDRAAPEKAVEGTPFL